MCVLLGAGLGAAAWSLQADPVSLAEPAKAQVSACDVLPPAEEVTTGTAWNHAVRPQPWGTRAPIRLPRVDAGIPMGEGTFLPPLNGIRVEDGIPPVRRDRRLPPPGAVVAKIVDRSGQEWWEHADGSQTSCSRASVTGPDGVAREIVSTQHGAVTPRMGGRAP